MLLNVFLGGFVCILRCSTRRFVVSERVSQVLVSSTSNELLHRFGTWDASDLKDWRIGDSTGFQQVSFRSTPHPVTVTTRIITFLVGNPYKPSFATVTGWGVDPRYLLG